MTKNRQKPVNTTQSKTTEKSHDLKTTIDMPERDESWSSQHVKVDRFEGPLDLLLFLIQKSQINIYDIPICEITEQYLAYLQLQTKPDIDNLVDFYAMAALLLLIKSRMLLPLEVDLEEEIGDPRSELVEKLIEYQKFKKYSEAIAAREQELEWKIERKKQQPDLPFAEDEVWQKIDVWDLLQSFSEIAGSLSNEEIFDLYEEVSVNEKLTLINEILELQNEIKFSELFEKNRSRLDLVCTFIAILELVKSQRVFILQNKFYGDIKIRKRNGVE